jgi:hypothetical protein
MTFKGKIFYINLSGYFTCRIIRLPGVHNLRLLLYKPFGLFDNTALKGLYTSAQDFLSWAVTGHHSDIIYPERVA